MDPNGGYIIGLQYISDSVSTLLEIKENEKGFKEIRKKSGDFDKSPNVKVLPLLEFILMISVSARLPYQEVMEYFLSSGRNQGKSENGSKKESGHPI